MIFAIRLLGVPIALCIAQFSVAQTHYNSWYRSTLHIPVHRKITADLEFQHRRQDGIQNDNPFSQNLLFSFRSWFHYLHGTAAKFSFSPFAYYTHYKIIRELADENRHPTLEIRIAASMDWQHSLAPKLYLATKMGIEYRILNHGQKNITRYRNRIGIHYSFGKKCKVGAYNELFLNLNGVLQNHLFDHNRFLVQLEYKPTAHWKFETGLIRLYRTPNQDNVTVQETNIFVNFAYSFYSE